MQLATQEYLADETTRTVITAEIESAPTSKTPEQLAEIVSQFASSGGWMERVRLCTERRWYERLYVGQDYDIWAISWMPGQSTGFHDHGESAGAFVVTTGALEEHRPGMWPGVISAGQPRAFGRDYTHDVRNASLAPAVSIHAYSPPLSEMNEYEMDGSELIRRDSALERAEAAGGEWSLQRPSVVDRPMALSIDQILAAARARLRRLSPEEAYDAVSKAGAVLVDIRPEAQRASEGSIPGALLIERNVLEWRFDPASSARLPIATSHDIEVIVVCSEGYTSSLAASALQDLGLWRATDVVGGFHSWRKSGLPTGAPSKVLSDNSDQETA